jgi:RNA polymerase sigma-70 factor (ECF subfamily)
VHDALEREIRFLHEQGEMEKAATVALEGYGREVLGFLLATLRDEDTASDVFAQMSEDLWRSLPTFEWRCTFRTYIYTLARYASARFWRSPHNEPRRRVPLSRISEVAQRVRTATLPHLRTEAKDRFAALRQSLDPDDQTLLILRINRRMKWDDIAGIMDEPTPRLRKRFQALKDRMRARAQREGLLDPSS